MNSISSSCLTKWTHYTEDVDIVLIDTGAGISPNVLFFNIRRPGAHPGGQQPAARHRRRLRPDQDPGVSTWRDQLQAVGERSGAPPGGGIGLSYPAQGGGAFSGPGDHLGFPRFCPLRSSLAQSGNETAAGHGPTPSPRPASLSS